MYNMNKKVYLLKLALVADAVMLRTQSLMRVVVVELVVSLIWAMEKKRTFPKKIRLPTNNKRIKKLMIVEVVNHQIKLVTMRNRSYNKCLLMMFKISNQKTLMNGNVNELEIKLILRKYGTRGGGRKFSQWGVDEKIFLNYHN